MKVKNVEILNGYESLTIFLNSDLGAKASFITNRLLKTIAPIYSDILEGKELLLKKYAKLTPEGKLITDEKGIVNFESEENRKKYLQEIKELFEIENEIECSLINIDDLEKAEKKILSKYIILAEKFISE